METIEFANDTMQTESLQDLLKEVETFENQRKNKKKK